MAVKDWKALAAKSQKILADSIPKEYKISEEKLPPKSQLDVHNFPEECGLLSTEEINITRTPSAGIVKKISSGNWTAEEVTVAFCKRAVVGHQVVSAI